MRQDLAQAGSCWWVLKLSNTATITREWVALQHAHLVPFHDILLGRPPPPVSARKQMDIPHGMRAAMEAECNPSQVS